MAMIILGTIGPDGDDNVLQALKDMTGYLLTEDGYTGFLVYLCDQNPGVSLNDMRKWRVRENLQGLFDLANSPTDLPTPYPYIPRHRKGSK